MEALPEVCTPSLPLSLPGTVLPHGKTVKSFTMSTLDLYRRNEGRNVRGGRTMAESVDAGLDLIYRDNGTEILMHIGYPQKGMARRRLIPL